MNRLPKARYLPDPERLSVLAATITLAYTMTHFVVLPARELVIQLPGFYLSAQFSINTLIALMVAGLTAAGSDWLIRDHPLLQGKGAWQHALLPALSAWAIGIPLSQLPFGLIWWLVLATGATVLILIMTAEYVVIDPEDVRYPIAAAWLTAVAYFLFLVLAITLRTIGIRLFFILPALTLASGLIGLRTLHLRLHGEWMFVEAGMIALILGQTIAPLHYWPLSPVAFSLAVLGPAYALTSLVGGLAEGKKVRQVLIEPVIALILALTAAIWIR